MKKGKEIKKIAEKTVRGKFDWKTFFKKVWKISFNTSAVAGVVAVGVMGTARILPTETKSSVQRAINKFESPIEEALTDSTGCSDWAGPYVTVHQARIGLSYLEGKFWDDEDFKAICITNAEQKTWNALMDEVSSYPARSYPVTEEDYKKWGDDARNMVNPWHERQNECINYQNEFGDFSYKLSPKYGTEDSISKEEFLRLEEVKRKYMTCYAKLESDRLLAEYGVKAQPYDYVNKRFMEEQ